MFKVKNAIKINGPDIQWITHNEQANIPKKSELFDKYFILFKWNKLLCKSNKDTLLLQQSCSNVNEYS